MATSIDYDAIQSMRDPDAKKIVFGGAHGVGKTSLLYHYLHHVFPDDTKTHVGSQFHTQILERQQKKISLEFWDIGEPEAFKSIQENLGLMPDGAFLLHDLSDAQTLENIRDEWIPFVREIAIATIPIVLVGTKMDLVDEDQLHEMELQAQEIVTQHGLSASLVTSSKEDMNIEETVLYLVDLLIENIA